MYLGWLDKIWTEENTGLYKQPKWIDVTYSPLLLKCLKPGVNEDGDDDDDWDFDDKDDDETMAMFVKHYLSWFLTVCIKAFLAYLLKYPDYCGCGL